MDAPLSSILRPGPAAPNNAQPRQNAGEGDGDAMRAIEGQQAPRHPAEPRPPHGAQNEALVERNRPEMPPLARPASDPLATARAVFDAQQARGEPPRVLTAGERRPADVDLFAGLEAAALRDIGEELGRPGAADADRAPERREHQVGDGAAATTSPEDKPKLTPEERQERRAARQSERAAAEGADSDVSDDAERQERRAARLAKRQAASGTPPVEPEGAEPDEAGRQERRAARLAKRQAALGTSPAEPAAAEPDEASQQERRAARLAKRQAADGMPAVALAAGADPEAAESQGRRAAKQKKKQAAGLPVAALAAGAASGVAERRASKLKNREERDGDAAFPAPAAAGALAEKTDPPVRKRDKDGKALRAPREWGIPWTAISFLAMVVIPTAVAAFYYIMIASPQFQVESQFSVRGSSASSMSTLGLGSILGGTSAQSGDSYIVASYVESLQLIRDVQQELGVDLRHFYTRDHIDWLYRIEPDMPLEKFTEYWRSMTEVSFNATTGNTTLLVYGFSAEDSKAIADAVLKVAERLVNQLSESNRQQMMQVASKQVDRAEERLRKVQGEIRKLRIEEKVTDPGTLIQMQTQAVSTLRGQLSSLETRLGALMKSVSPEAPQAKSLNKQIDALKAQIAEQEAQLGNTSGDPKKKLSDEERANLAEVLNKFEELTIEQSFATQAYTTALAAFETAIVEAQRQERYFATFVTPTRPEIALFPLRYLDSFIAFLVLLAIWMVTQFLYRSFRDHAV